jgi:hypothetical protein
MAIVVNDLKFFASERLTDESDGGGKLSAVEIADGTENGVFDDLSDVARAVGSVSIRKIYAAVMSETDDKYLDAGVVIFKPPEDPAVSVLAFSTGDSYDERGALKNKLESSISRGSMYGGYLWGEHNAGQRSVTLWQRPTTELPSIGRRLEMAAYSGGTQTHSQVLWITRVTDALITRYDAEGAFQIRRLICEIAEALTGDYGGTEPSRYDNITTTTKVYDTRYNSGALALFGIKSLTAPVETGAYTVAIEDLYAPLIPTAFVETDLPDVTPGGDSAALVRAATGPVTFATALNCIGPGKSLFLGSGAMPGSVAITVSGSTLTDANGLMRLAGAEVGTISYSNGVIVWNDACPNYGTTAKSVNFTPAATPLRVEDTAAQGVTVENRGFVWILTLAPIPAPGSLRISYRVNNEWYTITDGGTGILAGANSAYGSGTIDYTTGTAVLQTAELPDVNSDILYVWSTAVNYFIRGGEPVAPATVRGTTVNPNVIPSSVSVSWINGATTYTITDAGGTGDMTGTGGTGFIDYPTGRWWIIPSPIPAMGTEITIDYDYGDPETLVSTEFFDDPALGADGLLSFTLEDLPLAGTVSVAVGVVSPEFFENWEETENIPPPTPPVPDEPYVPPEPPPIETPVIPPAPIGIQTRWYIVTTISFDMTRYCSAKVLTEYTTKAAAVAAAIVLEGGGGVQTVNGTLTINGSTVTCNGFSLEIQTHYGAPSGAGPHSATLHPSTGERTVI